MKKRSLLSLLAILFIASTMVFTTSCGEEDTTAPTLTLDGDNPMVLDLNDTYTEPGYTAEDDGKDISGDVTVSGEPTATDKVQEHTVTYTVADKEGNSTTKDRIVQVGASDMIKTYVVNEVDQDGASITYNPVISSTQTYNKLLVQNFGGFGSNISIGIVCDNTGAITVPEDSFSYTDQDGYSYNVAVSGSGGSYDGANEKILVVKYTADFTGDWTGTLTYTGTYSLVTK